MKRMITIATVLALSAVGCMQEEQIDQQLLAEYRAALPGEGELLAAAPQASRFAAFGDPALYPTVSWPMVEAVNGSVRDIITTMETIVALPPTVYNSDTLEFFWGPMPSDDGLGYVAAYIRDAGDQEDFRYHYALLRGIDNDIANLTPVIWGGATPDPNNDDHGFGITMWDFEANYAFEQAHNSEFENNSYNRGRYVALYGAGMDEENPGNEMTFVVSIFRNFVPEDAPGEAPADLDYFYGRYVTPEFTADFLDWETMIDLEPADQVLENIGVRMAFLDEGMGRAEGDVSGGSLEANQEGRVTECWGDDLLENYISYEMVTDGVSEVIDSDGEFGNCGLFQASLDELQIPSLDDIDPAMLDAMSELAITGVPAQ